MRMIVILSMAVLVAVPAFADGERRTSRCCVELGIPEVPPGALCVQVHGRHGLRPRLACRLLGGRPIGRGDCSPAACRMPAA
jgi:hypothetical protein